MSAIIAHIDLNAFFATVEQLEDPSLRGKPIAIGGSSNRGIIVTASYEARTFGIHAGMPTYQARQKCPSLIIVGHHFELYEQYSSKFIDFIKRNAAKVETASIDECYADFSFLAANTKDPMPYFKHLQQQLLKETGLMSSWGIAPTKFLAKMASDLKKPMGITVVRKRDISKILFPLSVDRFYGIGKKTVPKLESLGIRTIGDLQSPRFEESLRRILGKFYFAVQEWLRGEGDDQVDDQAHDPKSVGNSSTLSENTKDPETIMTELKALTEEVFNRTMAYQLKPKTLTLTIKTPDFKVKSKSMSIREIPLQFQEVFQRVEKLYRQHFYGQIIRLAGVSFHNLEKQVMPTNHISLFESSNVTKPPSKTDQIIESINQQFHKKILKKASER